MKTYEIEQGALGRYVIVAADARHLAWSGSRWVPHFQGIPADVVQVCSFETKEEAEEYAEEHLG